MVSSAMKACVSLVLVATIASCAALRPAGRAELGSSFIGPMSAAAESLYGNITHVTLANGLEVYVKPVAGSGTVSTMLAYRVGSADEAKNFTGLSHYLEHLMFKGTEKLMPGDIDRVTLRNGGANNAYTDNDVTVYHFDFAADRWEQALAIEADRMRNIRIDERHEFELEKGAVIEELRGGEDQPWDLEHKKLMPLLFGEGPYGHPVIGEMEHVRAATAEVIQAHYDRWYHPNNAVLVICGDVQAAEAVALARKHFENIPRGELPNRNAEVPVTRTEPARVEFASKFTMPRLLMAWNGVRIGSADDYVLDVISQVLTGGDLSRLHRKLVLEEEIAMEVLGGHVAGRYPGYLQVAVTAVPGANRAEMEAIVTGEIRRLAEEGVSTEELTRAIRTIIAQQIFAHESVHDLADSIAFMAAVADVDYLRGYFRRLMSVTSADIQRVARQHLAAEKRAVVWSVPEEEKRQQRRGGQVAQSAAMPHGLTSRLGRNAVKPGAPRRGLADVQRVVLPNGLTLLLLEDARLPMITAGAEVRYTHLLQDDKQVGVAELTGRLLSEGTARRSGDEVSEIIEGLGGAMAFNSSGGMVRVLSPDRKAGLGLLLECMAEANFPADAFERERDHLLADIEEATQTPPRAAEETFRRLVYGKSPLARAPLGELSKVKSLTPEQCAAFHRRVFVPGNITLAVVGDFDARQLIAEVTQLTANWKGDKPTPPVLPPLEQGKMQQRYVTLPGAAQLQVLTGHVGIRRASEDYYKLLVMDHVLGTGPGFTDRLTSRLRDREGLAYSVSGHITATAGLEPGTFVVSIGTEAKNLPRVRAEIMEEVNRLRDEPPTDTEVADAKAYLLGRLPFLMAKSDSIIDAMLMVERFGLGGGYLQEFRRQVSSVTAADVQAMARKYLQPQRMIFVAVGPIDAQGKPLK